MVRVHLGRVVSYTALTVTMAVLLLTLSNLSLLHRPSGVGTDHRQHILLEDQRESRDTRAFSEGRQAGDARYDASDSRFSDPTLMIDDTGARELRSRPGGRVLCWVPTTPKQLNVKVKAVNTTWIQRCDGHIFFMEPEEAGMAGGGGDSEAPKEQQEQEKTRQQLPFWDVVSLDVPRGYYNLTTKVVTILLYLYRYHLHDYDWFLKGDDDAYVVMENLRYLLSLHDSRQPVYLGHLFKRFLPKGYMAGGASYVLSQQALKVLVEQGYNKNKCSTKGRYEDLEVGRCLHVVGVESFNSRDRFGRDSFHPLRPSTHILGPIPAVQLPQDYFTMLSGKECCSQLTISFHKVPPDLMVIFDHLLYRTSVYGRVPDMQALQGLVKPGVLPSLQQ